METQSRATVSASPYTPIEPFARWVNVPAFEEDWESSLRRYREVESVALPETRSQVARRLGREAAAETGAIEGLYELRAGQSRTIANEDSGWETVLTDQASVKTFDSQFDAYEHISQLAGAGEPLSEYHIRAIHEIVCRHQDYYVGYVVDGTGGYHKVQMELKKGQYKNRPNEVTLRDGTVVQYASVIDTPIEMGRLAKELQSTSFREAHPLLQAAYTHHSLTQIHPFPDGNGRVARAAASLFTYRACGLPIVVYADRKQAYLQALEAADKGQFGLFVQYITDRMIDTLLRATQELEALPRTPTQLIADELVSLASLKSELTIQKADATATGLLASLIASLKRVIGEVKTNEYFTIKLEDFYESDRAYITGSDYGYRPAYRPIASHFITVSLHKPHEFELNATFAVGVARDLGERFIFKVISRRETSQTVKIEGVPDLFLRYEDVYPRLSSAADGRVSLYAESLLREMLNLLSRDFRAVLRQTGNDTV